MDMEDKKIIIGCDCGMHLLHAETDKDCGFIYLAMFTYGNGNDKPRLWTRLKRALSVLKTGHLYSDQLVMNKANARELCAFLKEADAIIPEEPKPTVVIVNGLEALVRPDEFGKVTYDDVVKMIGKDPNFTWTVTYNNRNNDCDSGILHKGKSVTVSDGMIFNIQNTNNS